MALHSLILAETLKPKAKPQEQEKHLVKDKTNKKPHPRTQNSPPPKKKKPKQARTEALKKMRKKAEESPNRQ